jgi:sugar/nucleoside kinase (ribokinase family)
LQGTGINLDHVQLRQNCENQSAYIVIDRSTGERTVLWRRNDCLRIDPEQIAEEQIACARLLHIDGHDTPAVAHAAAVARRHGIPVTVDVDTIYHGFDLVLPNVDYLVASSEFPTGWTGETDPFKALETIQNEYGMRVAAMTLGAHGSLARSEGRYHYSPAYVVNCVDTTGAGDVFHGAFCYAVLEGMAMAEALEFSNAMAALNCTAVGARGGVRGMDEIRALMARAERRSHPDISARAAAHG